MTGADVASEPRGAPERVELDGILDGRVADPAALQAAVADLSGVGAGDFDCDLQGGRFSLLPQSTSAPGAGFDEDGQQRFLQALQAVVAAAAPDSVESTLRCRMVFAAVVVETLFAVRRGAVEPMSRVRERPAAERAAAPEPERLPFGLGRRELLLLAPVLVVVGLWWAWQSGLVDGVLAARAERLVVEPGPFRELLDLRVERSWGRYHVEVRRGPAYPADPVQLAQRRDAAASLTERAAIEAVGDGSDVWLQVRDEHGRTLAAAPVSLRPLVAAPDAVARQKLPGRMRAAAIAVSLTAAEPEPK